MQFRLANLMYVLPHSTPRGQFVKLARSFPEVDPPIAGADSAFCLHGHKIAVAAPAPGSNPTLLVGQKRRVSPGSRGKKIAVTRQKKGESDSPRGFDPRAGAACKHGNYHF